MYKPFSEDGWDEEYIQEWCDHFDRVPVQGGSVE